MVGMTAFELTSRFRSGACAELGVTILVQSQMEL
jgi:hypothetical protein